MPQQLRLNHNNGLTAVAGFNAAGQEKLFLFAPDEHPRESWHFGNRSDLGALLNLSGISVHDSDLGVSFSLGWQHYSDTSALAKAFGELGTVQDACEVFGHQAVIAMIMGTADAEEVKLNFVDGQAFLGRVRIGEVAPIAA